LIATIFILGIFWGRCKGKNSVLGGRPQGLIIMEEKVKNTQTNLRNEDIQHMADLKGRGRETATRSSKEKQEKEQGGARVAS
jgi:hypothetical protein